MSYDCRIAVIAVLSNLRAMNTHDRLGVAVLPGHRQVQAKEIAVDYVDVARLWTTQGVDSPVEWFVCSHLDCDSRVLAVYRY